MNHAAGTIMPWTNSRARRFGFAEEKEQKVSVAQAQNKNKEKNANVLCISELSDA